VKAVFRREARRLGNGATLFRWELLTAHGRIVDGNLATVPTLQGSEILFVSSENVDCLDSVAVVTRLAGLEQGKQLALYRIAKDSCTVSADLPRVGGRPDRKGFGGARPSASFWRAGREPSF
jgi:hypothetical protein